MYATVFFPVEKRELSRRIADTGTTQDLAVQVTIGPVVLSDSCCPPSLGLRASVDARMLSAGAYRVLCAPCPLTSSTPLTLMMMRLTTKRWMTLSSSTMRMTRMSTCVGGPSLVPVPVLQGPMSMASRFPDVSVWLGPVLVADVAFSRRLSSSPA